MITIPLLPKKRNIFNPNPERFDLEDTRRNDFSWVFGRSKDQKRATLDQAFTPDEAGFFCW